MVQIIFESHATSYDNESGVCSGFFDVELSPLGIKQAEDLGRRYKDQNFDAIFCSDLSRSYKTAEIAFEKRNFKIIKDKRLRECNYGDFTRFPSKIVDPEKLKRISKPFPNGESYNQCVKRMKDFLSFLLDKYDGERVMIIGHAATRYSLKHLINKKSLKEIISEPWKWQPGWKYQLKAL